MDAVELLASVEHERWAHWQSYMHDRAIRQSDGSLLIPAELVERWERLMATPYSGLSEDEKKVIESRSSGTCPSSKKHSVVISRRPQ